MFDYLVGCCCQYIQKVLGNNIESFFKFNNIIAVLLVYHSGHRMKVMPQRLKTKWITVLNQFIFQRIVLKVADDVIRFFLDEFIYLLICCDVFVVCNGVSKMLNEG